MTVDATRPATSSLLLQAAAARRKKLADLKTEILGDPIHLASDDESEDDEDRELNDDNDEADDAMEVDAPRPRRKTRKSRNGDAEADGEREEGPIAKAEREAVAAYLALTEVPTVEDLATAILAQSAQEQRERAERSQSDMADISELAPKKANADLKRELARRAARLEQQTQAVMYELLRERVLNQQSGGSNGTIASASASAAEPGAASGDVDLADAVDAMYSRSKAPRAAASEWDED
ncbi:hypothetical protein H9P43_001775 [Blastocladiella emersonii ATCC 22665]|nr:hypothetical protein H9P43_001775 [Blastocladiella emersonii ATCC 22665]